MHSPGSTCHAFFITFIPNTSPTPTSDGRKLLADSTPMTTSAICKFRYGILRVSSSYLVHKHQSKRKKNTVSALLLLFNVSKLSTCRQRRVVHTTRPPPHDHHHTATATLCCLHDNGKGIHVGRGRARLAPQRFGGAPCNGAVHTGGTDGKGF